MFYVKYFSNNRECHRACKRHFRGNAYKTRECHRARKRHSRGNTSETNDDGGKHSRSGKEITRIWLLLLMFAACAEVRSQPSRSHGSQTGGLQVTLKSTETSITVEWTAHDSSVRDFKVTLHAGTFIRETNYIDANSERKTAFDDLLPCLAYTVSVQPLDADGDHIGSSGSQSLSTLSAAPPAATRLSSQNSAEGLTLTWERPATACEITAYTITYSGVAKWGPRTEHRGSATIGRGAAEDATGVAINGLQPYTDYTVMVAAATDKGVRELAFINTITKEAAPTKPTNLQLLRSTASTVSLIWKEPNEMKGVLKGYEVSCYSGATRVLTETTDHPVHIIGGLAACTEYTVQVAASTAGGRSDPIAIPVKTTAGQPPPVTDFAARDITHKSFSLTWKRPATACEITAYTITYSGRAKSGPQEEHKGSVTIGRGDANDATSITINSLKPYTYYTVMVTASTEAGEGQTPRIDVIVTDDVPKKATSQEPDDATQRESNSIWPGFKFFLLLVAAVLATLIISVTVSVLVARRCSLLHGRHVKQQQAEEMEHQLQRSAVAIGGASGISCPVNPTGSSDQLTDWQGLRLQLCHSDSEAE